MKRNKLFIAGIVTVFVALLSLTLVSSTLAKYTSTATGSDTARVAKWNWTYNGGQLKESNALTFDLFNTIKDTGGAVEEDVDADLIAPGTSGSFTFSLTNASEVNGQYSIAFESAETVEQIQYSLDGTNWHENISSLNVTAKAVDMGQSDAITVYWQWRFEVSGEANITDTADGKAGNVEHQVQATITFEQVD